MAVKHRLTGEEVGKGGRILLPGYAPLTSADPQPVSNLSEPRPLPFPKSVTSPDRWFQFLPWSCGRFHSREGEGWGSGVVGGATALLIGIQKLDSSPGAGVCWLCDSEKITSGVAVCSSDENMRP